MKLSNAEKSRLRQNYGDWAIVTGASSGIGLELAERLAEAGLNLVIIARDVNKLMEVEIGLKAKYDVDIKVILHYLDIPIEDLWHRIRKRNLELPENCFHITREELNQWMSWFTPPNRDEFILYDEYEVHEVC